MVVFPNARITIGLQVKMKRPDGFHEIESLMVPVSLHDALEIMVAPDGQTRFIVSGLSIPDDGKKNLCLRAYDELQDYLYKNPEYPKNTTLPPLHIHLHKAIPAGSGLAGGSADAAFMLKLLNSYFDLNISKNILTTIAAKTGSDCPFFIHNTPMIASGRGEVLKKWQYKEIRKYHIIISIPPIQINTTDAYRLILPKTPEFRISDALNEHIDNWQELLINDFEKVVFKRHPAIANIKTLMLELGARYASLSGSGSAVFGIFDDLQVLDNIRYLFPQNLTVATKAII